MRAADDRFRETRTPAMGSTPAQCVNDAGSGGCPVRQILATGVTPVPVNTILGRLEYLRAYVEECASTPSGNDPARAQTIDGGAFRFRVFPYRRIHRLETRILAKEREARLQFCVVPPILQTQVIGG